MTPLNPFGTPPLPPRQGRRSPGLPTRRDLVTAAVVAVVMAVAGVALGLLWSVTAPKVDLTAAFKGSESAFDAQAGVDVHFAFFSGLFGLALGFLAGWRARHAAWPLAVGLAVGGLGGSLIAGVVGHAMRSSDVLDDLPPDATQRGRDLVDFMLRAHGFYFVLPAAALFAYLLVVFFATKPEPPELPDGIDPTVYWSVPR